MHYNPTNSMLQYLILILSLSVLFSTVGGLLHSTTNNNTTNNDTSGGSQHCCKATEEQSALPHKCFKRPACFQCVS